MAKVDYAARGGNVVCTVSDWFVQPGTKRSALGGITVSNVFTGYFADSDAAEWSAKAVAVIDEAMRKIRSLSV